MAKLTISFILAFVASAASASSVFAQAPEKPAMTIDTFIDVRTATDRGAYHLLEVFQSRGKWIYPDVGYIDFDQAKEYREWFAGAGGTVVDNKVITVIAEGYLDKATGPASGGALYFLPWGLLVLHPTSKVHGEVVYFPYVPLNHAARIQHVIERAKLEYDFGHFKLGGGYGAYRYADGPWQNKPFVTATLKAGQLGNFEFWLQRLPGGHATVQVRYDLALHHKTP